MKSLLKRRLIVIIHFHLEKNFYPMENLFIDEPLSSTQIVFYPSINNEIFAANSCFDDQQIKTTATVSSTSSFVRETKQLLNLISPENLPTPSISLISDV